MSIRAINFMGAAPATQTKTAEVKTPEQKEQAKKTAGIVAGGISAAALAAMAIVAIRKGKANELANKVYHKVISCDNRIGGLINTARINKTIAEVAERTSEAGVTRRAAELAEAFGGEVEHVAQRASIIADKAVA